MAREERKPVDRDKEAVLLVNLYRRPTLKELFANGHHARVTQAMLPAEFLS